MTRTGLSSPIIFIELFRKLDSLQSVVFFNEAGHELTLFTDDMASYLTSGFHTTSARSGRKGLVHTNSNPAEFGVLFKMGRGQFSSKFRHHD
jgi:hypothetical protein